MPTIIFKAKDYYGVLAEECKLTIVGKFLKHRPKIEVIRVVFMEWVAIKGLLKIGAYDNYTVFINFSNEEDCKSVYYRRSIDMHGAQMWL